MGGFSGSGSGSAYGDGVYGDGWEDGRDWSGGRPGDRRDERLGWFEQDCPGGPLRPNADLAVLLDVVSGPERRCDGGTDSELLGIAGRWAAVEAWAFAARLGVVRELIRRRPRPDAERERVGRGDAPAPWERGLEHEVSVELRISLTAAGKLLYLAWALESRLPRVGQALEEGRLDPARARMIVDETDLLDDAPQVARAEEMILAGLEDCRTWAALQRLAALAVCTVDPAGAARRREVAERENARIRLWRESSGAAGLGGYSLPPDETLAAMAHVEARAQWYRKAGIKERIDMLRVMAFLDLLSCIPAPDRVTRWQAEQAAMAGAAAGEEGTPGGEAVGDEPAPGMDPGSRTGGGHYGHDEDDRSRNGRGHNDRADGDGPTGDGRYGRDDNGHDYGDLDHDGSGDARDDRDPSRASSNHSGGGRDPSRAFCHLSSDDLDPSDDDRGGGESCDDRDGGRPDGSGGGGGPGRGSGGGRPRPDASAPNGAMLPALPALVNLTLPLATQLRLAERPGEARGLGALDPGLVRRLAEAAARSPHSKFCVTIVDEQGHAIAHGCCKPARKARDTSTAAFTLSGKSGPRDGYGSWILTLPGAVAPFTVDLYPVPVGECDHRYESPGHDPGGRLRHLIQVRDGKCSFPTCFRNAKETDFEHGIPYEKGGRTCGCNCHSCSRACHQVKQQPGWTVAAERPGWHTWTTPSGRTYTQGPWKYPA